jgi:hypothetical protein
LTHDVGKKTFSLSMSSFKIKNAFLSVLSSLTLK